ncbi:MAG: hypothetical protein LBS71_00210 [Puniceicoccales bacterium]|jgi:hypothetical protein|nr:hypothetical protein [Puniceicoccales bacterium]
MDLKGHTKVVLCIDRERISLCQVADQNGRGYILSTQVIHSEKNPNNTENWLSITLAKFDLKLLKKVKEIIFSTNIVSSFPLDVFYSNDVHFYQAALFEFKHLLGNRLDQFQFGLYKMDEKQMACAFLILKSQLTQFLKTFSSFSIKNPIILISPVMFVDEVKRQVVNGNTVFLNVGHNILSIVLQNGAEQHSSALPISMNEWAKKISHHLNREITEADLCASLNDSTSNPQLLPLLDECFNSICFEINKRAKEFFKENRELIFVIGGSSNIFYYIAQSLAKIGNVQPYHVFFKQQISPVIESTVVAAVEAFIPALLSTATLDKKRLTQVVNLKIDALTTKLKKRSYNLYQPFLTSLICVTSILFYFSQKIDCQYMQSAKENKRLLMDQTRIKDLTKHIEVVNAHVKEQTKILDDIIVYTEQSRAACELLNSFQEILFRAGDVYLTSFIWNVKSEKSKPKVVAKSPPNAKPAETKAGDIVVEVKKKEPVPTVSASINLVGAMFIGDVEITEEVKQKFNDKFNVIFESIRQLPVCANLVDIKVNSPENCKIIFRCTMHLVQKSKLLAL